MKALFGSSPKPSTSTQVSGYSALPQELQAAFNPMGTAIGQYTNPNNAGVTQAFTPMSPTGAENTAMSNINAGFAPTQQSISSDMALQMNPYNESVINEINRQGQGQYSVMKQAMDSAGQAGSNRSILGANDIDLSRQNLIGSFLNNQFNTSMNNALTTMPNARSADASNQMDVGSFLRSLGLQQATAPVSALRAGTSLMAPFISGGSGSETGAKAGTNGLFGSGGDWTQAAGTALSFMFSDPRLKQNIKHIGKENGHNIYEFNYRGENQKYIGVMADEVQETHPEAVKEIQGYLAVNYPMIGVNFREAR